MVQKHTCGAVVLLLVLQLSLAAAGSGCASTRGSAGPTRKVRFWLTGNAVAPSSPPYNGTAAPGECKPYLLRNLTRYRHAIDSLGIYAFTVKNNSIVDDGGIAADPGFWPCVKRIRTLFPNISIGAVGGGSDEEFVWIARNPEHFGDSARAWINSHHGE